MSSFNPQNRQLSPDEWRDVAHDSVSQFNAQITVIGGVVLGLFAGAAASPITGALVAAYFLHKAWQDTQAANRNDRAIQGYGCVAHVLKGDDLRDFAAQVGAGEVTRQVQFAQERGLNVTADALDYLETQGVKALPPTPEPQSIRQPELEPAVKKSVGSEVAIGNHTRLNEIDVSATATPASNATPDDIALSLAESLQSTLIVGQPGAGKGMLIAQATRAVKQLHPDVKIWAIDPKADPAEAWYWEAVDHYLPAPLNSFTNSDAIAKVCQQIDGFIQQFQASPGAKLLIFDEALAVKEKSGRWFKGLMAGFNALCSMGRSRRQYGWLVSQSPNTDDFGISGGVRNVYRRILLLSRDNLGLLDNGSTFFSGKPSQALFQETGRVYFDSLVNGWGSVPRYVMPSRRERLERSLTAEAAHPVEEFYHGSAAPESQQRNLYEELAADLESSQPQTADFVRWLATKQSKVLSQRDIIQLWGNKKDRGCSSKESIAPFIAEAIGLGLLIEVETGYRVIDLSL